MLTQTCFVCSAAFEVTEEEANETEASDAPVK